MTKSFIEQDFMGAPVLSNEPEPLSLSVGRREDLFPIMFIARASIEPTSETFAGKTNVLLALASSPNLLMYCSATRNWIASYPPGSEWIRPLS